MTIRVDNDYIHLNKVEQIKFVPISIGLHFHSLCCDQRPDQALGAVLLVFARTWLDLQCLITASPSLL